jgi:hypothetical protein
MYQYAFYPFTLMVIAVIYILVCCHYRDKYELRWNRADEEINRMQKKKWDTRAQKGFKWFIVTVVLLAITIIVEQLKWI